MRKSFSKKEGGQAMVEFALILPLLILLLCGIIDFGWIYGNQIQLNNASRDTARFMAINYGTSTDTQADATANTTLRNRLGTGNYMNNTNLNVNSTKTGDTVSVTATYPLPFLTPLLSTVLHRTVMNLSSTTTMRIE